MERRRGSVSTNKRIQWSQSLEASLVQIAEKCEPSTRGYHARLEELWLSNHHTLPSSGSALAQKCRRIKILEEQGMTESHDAEKDSEPSQSPSQDLKAEELREEMCSMWQAEVESGPNNLLNRDKSLSMKTQLNPTVVDLVGAVAMEMWKDSPEKSLWELNSLYYVAGIIANDRSKMPNQRSDMHLEVRDEAPNDMETEGNDLVEHEQVEEEEEESGQGYPDGSQTQPHHSLKMSKRKIELKIRDVRRTIGWLEAELSRLTKRGRKVQTRRQRTINQNLRRIFGKRYDLNVPGLRALRVRQRAILRIRLLQERKVRKREKQDQVRAEVDRRGPKSMGRSGQNTAYVTEAQASEMAVYWGNLWQTPGRYAKHHRAITDWREEMKGKMVGLSSEPPDKNEVWNVAIRKQPSWKAPGPDGIPAIWLKAFRSLHGPLREGMEEMLDGTREIPECLVQGRTVMIPKVSATWGPEKYRPIACLNTMYKLLTGITAETLMDHITKMGILPEEQKAMRRGARGCLDALTVDESIAREARIFRKSQSVGWVDYQKAYDMVPHRWIKDMLRAIRAPKEIRRTVKAIIPKWKTTIVVKTSEATTTRIPIHLKRGLYQGDSLSPILFCMCVAPISVELGKGKGFPSRYQRRPVTHVMYMDDLKVYEISPTRLESTLRKVQEVSEAVGMRLGIPKCAVAHMRRGLISVRGDMVTSHREKISELGGDGTYRYLGVEQQFGPNRQRTKARVIKEYLNRVSRTWNSQLSARSRAVAHNSWAASVLTYFFGIVRWTRSDMRALDRKTRKILSRKKCHQAGASLERLYLPRSEGGRGLVNLEMAWERECTSVAVYLMSSRDEHVQGAVRLHEHLAGEGGYSPIVTARLVMAKYGLEEECLDGSRGGSGRKGESRMLKQIQKETMMERLNAKKIHGVYFKEMTAPGVDTRGTCRWLEEGRLMAETEAILVAAQDGVISTRAYRVRIKKEAIESLCRVCGQREETLGHILSACTAYQWGLYKERHDRVLYVLARTIARKLGLTLPSSMRKPGGVAKPRVMGGGETTLSIDQSLPTERQVGHRRPDLTVWRKKERQVVIYEVACAWDPRVNETEKVKRGKYQELAADISRQWPGYKISVVPVVVGDLGTMCNLREQMMRGGILDEREVQELATALQRETLCSSAVKIIKRHMCYD